MKKYLDQDGTKHLVRKLDESIDKKIQNTVKNATATEAGLVKVEGTSRESAPYTVYSKGKLADKLTEVMNDWFEDYQPKLTAGENITIDENTISSTASYDDTQLKADLAKKQDKLAAGSNISISSNRISVNQGSGSGLDADKLDGYHADQFFRKNNDIYQIKGRFNARINSNLSSIKWVTIDDIFFYDISFAVIGDPTEINNGLAPIASLQFRRPLSRTTYLDAISPAGVFPRQFEVRSNGEIYLNKNIHRSIQPKIPYLLKGIGTSV